MVLMKTKAWFFHKAFCQKRRFSIVSRKTHFWIVFQVISFQLCFREKKKVNKQIYIREISDCHPTKLQRLSKQLDQKEVLICLVLTSKFPYLLFDVFASSFLNFSLQYYCLLFLSVVELVNHVITPSVTTTFISCTNHCVTWKTVYAFLHYLNKAVSRCIHLQHQEFIPYTSFAN